MAEWEEIKRLAADFQRTQTSDTLQRISERNCIDIVKKLTDLGLIELVYTCDGKEFLTPEHLRKEIEDEICVNAGRVHLHDLASNLNVDYQHVENKAKELARDRPDEYNVILGQVIHSSYKATLGKQIYDTMITSGQLSIAEFSKSLDLPSEFLLTMIKDILPQVLDEYVVSPDGRTYYTSDMMDRYKSIIAGTMSAIKKPTTVASIMKKLDIPERMFAPILDGLIKENRLDAVVENRLFIPSIYAREQNEWIDKFYSANSYIDYDVLARKNIKQPKAFLKKRFPEGIQLKNCFVSPALLSQVESLIEDCIASNGLIDISSIVPVSIQPEDIDLLLQDLFKKNKQFSSSCLILHQTNVCSLGFIATCKQSFGRLMSDRAEEHLKQGKLIEYFLGGNVRSRHQSNSETESTPATEQKNDEEEGKQAEQDAGGDKANADPKGSGRVAQQSSEHTIKRKDDSIELTAEDLKRERRQKKGKQTQRADEPIENQESDDDQGAKKPKGNTNRKSGGGAQGREIKQKATKKKYMAGKNKQVNDDSDNDQQGQPTGKAPRSNRGRASRRAPSPPQRQTAGQYSTIIAAKQSKASEKVSEREPLEFMSSIELVDSLRARSRDAGDFSVEVLESLAAMMAEELNKNYESLARKALDDHLKSSASKMTSDKSENDSQTEDAVGDEADEDNIDLVD